jgi:hypothetical protein
MPASLFHEMDRSNGDHGLEDQRALQLAFELSMLGLSGSHSAADQQEQMNPAYADDARSKKSQNMTECVPVPSSEHVAEIVGRQGKKTRPRGLTLVVLSVQYVHPSGGHGGHGTAHALLPAAMCTGAPVRNTTPRSICLSNRARDACHSNFGARLWRTNSRGPFRCFRCAACHIILTVKIFPPARTIWCSR